MPVLTALISLGSLGVSVIAWYSMRQRATRAEMLTMERRLATLETGPGWSAVEAMRQELRDMHGHIQRLAGEMRGLTHNTELILEQLLRDRHEVMP